MRHFYKPRHAADYNPQAARAATELSNGYQARHGTPGDFDYQPRHAVAVVYTGHGLSHGTYRPDVAL